jgi:hypothetical protein
LNPSYHHTPLDIAEVLAHEAGHGLLSGLTIDEPLVLNDDDELFVSPLRANCTSRFFFNRQGQIEAAQGTDQAAAETIRQLGLDHKELTALRKAAIQGALHPGGRPITLAEVEKLRREMDQDEEELNRGGMIKLSPFCFAIRPQLEREVTKLQAIRHGQ